ncbi:hypothetical protein BLNAU_9425 [Blattamonas nauphoetae]|uniref:Secreted protein n=1 Tax=Blattamonas nauphoetae TaxID=2049346 RepID=A0ABQ9XVR6_9EUKA|nr:hypothetical protein BLNAU_9425 [Blattamonas nauphoetae]
MRHFLFTIRRQLNWMVLTIILADISDSKPHLPSPQTHITASEPSMPTGNYMSLIPSDRQSTQRFTDSAATHTRKSQKPRASHEEPRNCQNILATHVDASAQMLLRSGEVTLAFGEGDADTRQQQRIPSCGERHCHRNSDKQRAIHHSDHSAD